jgi:flagellar FliL protein
MKEPKLAAGEKSPAASVKRKRGFGVLVIFAIIVLVLGGAGAAYLFVPAVADTVAHLTASQPAAQPGPPPAPRPQLVDIPEMVITMPNGGRPRQLRIRFSIELTPTAPDIPPIEVLSPRVYDALLTYFRTLRDSDIESSLAIDRIRGDLYRRLTLILGTGVVQNVLITSMVTG